MEIAIKQKHQTNNTIPLLFDMDPYLIWENWTATYIYIFICTAAFLIMKLGIFYLLCCIMTYNIQLVYSTEIKTPVNIWWNIEVMIFYKIEFVINFFHHLNIFQKWIVGFSTYFKKFRWKWTITKLFQQMHLIKKLKMRQFNGH